MFIAVRIARASELPRITLEQDGSADESVTVKARGVPPRSGFPWLKLTVVVCFSTVTRDYGEIVVGGAGISRTFPA